MMTEYDTDTTEMEESPPSEATAVPSAVRHLTEPSRRALLSAVVDFFTTQDRSSVLLELGCGDGFWLEVFRYLGFPRVYGIDVSLPLLERAAQKGLEVRQGDLYNLDVDDVFDIIFVCDTLEHLEDPKSALLRAHRALRTQGLLYLAVPVYDSLAERYDRLFHGATRASQSQSDDPGHLWAFSAPEVLALLDDCHFAVDSVGRVGNALPTSPPRPTLWTGGGRFGTWLCVAARSLFYVDWGGTAPGDTAAPSSPGDGATAAPSHEGEGADAPRAEPPAPPPDAEGTQQDPFDAPTTGASSSGEEGPRRSEADPDATELDPEAR
jgi:SAM-dependent methyltransferase